MKLTKSFYFWDKTSHANLGKSSFYLWSVITGFDDMTSMFGPQVSILSPKRDRNNSSQSSTSRLCSVEVTPEGLELTNPNALSPSLDMQHNNETFTLERFNKTPGRIFYSFNFKNSYYFMKFYFIFAILLCEGLKIVKNR